MIKRDDTVYVVYIDKEKVFQDNEYSGYLRDSVLHSGRFAARIENISSTYFIFSLNNSNDIVVIPHRWIKFMSPSRVYYEEKIKRIKTQQQNEELFKKEYMCIWSNEQKERN